MWGRYSICRTSRPPAISYTVHCGRDIPCVRYLAPGRYHTQGKDGGDIPYVRHLAPRRFLGRLKLRPPAIVTRGGFVSGHRIYKLQARYAHVYGGPPCRLSSPYKLHVEGVSRTKHSFSPSSVTHDRGEGCKRKKICPGPLDSSSKLLIQYMQTFFPITSVLHVSNNGRPLKFQKGRPLITIFKGWPGTDVPFVPL